VDRVERLTNLLALLLETPRPLTLIEIAGEMQGQYPTAKPTLRAAFERDKAALREIGVPIEAELLTGDRAGESGYRIDRARYELADLQLEDDERRAIQLALAAVRSPTGSAITAGEQALWKLGGGQLDVGPAVTASVPDLPALPTIRRAVARRAVIGFSYRGHDRRVDPYGLMLRDGFWYVLGRDHGHDELRTYRVDRIAGAVDIAGEDHSFERPAGFDPRDVLPTDAKQFGVAGDTATARVRIAPERAALVEREVGGDRVVARRRNGSIEVMVPAGNAAAFASWVLGLTDHAEVLSPKAVRDDLVRRLRALSEQPRRRRAQQPTTSERRKR
jgi:predicted DNA-binding transcriptional regulator YafY